MFMSLANQDRVKLNVAPGDLHQPGAMFALGCENLVQALPIPAALYRVSHDRVERIVCNERLSLVERAVAGQGGWILSDDTKIAEAVRFMVDAGRVSHEIDWTDEDDVSEHHYKITLAFAADDQAGVETPRLCLVTLIDRTAAIKAEQSLRAEMLRDTLTGLPNRTSFIEAIDAATNCGDDEARLAVLIVDLKRFSRVNESMGALAGDELIITVARRLVSALRKGDILARFGGNEFGVLIHLNEAGDDARQVARRIHASLLTPFRLSDFEIRIDCAIGYSLTTAVAADAEELVRYAQVALKRAKQSGKMEVYQPGEVAVARRRFSLETELRRAVEGGDLKLAFQPLVDLQNNRLAGFEALARWDHREHGSIPPVDFISVAEESGLIVPLGRWALTEAASTLAGWDRMAGKLLPLYVGVNVSAVQLVRDDIALATLNALDISGLDGSRLMLEITESAIIGDPERSARLLNALKELKTTIAMDDFGTGYSSLASLQKLPIDVLKIDHSFVTDMIGNRDSTAIVRAILSLASALGMHTTGEGIETADLAHTLAALGCSYGQGYYFSRPLSAEEAYGYYGRFNLSTEAS